MKNLRAVVTGASSGIGEALAHELANRGAHVVLVARRRAELDRVANSITSGGGSVEVMPCDLADPGACTSLAQQILAGGTPDLVIHNAGAGRWLAVDETPEGDAVSMMQLPYLAAFELTRALSPAMIERGDGRHVYMTSLAGYTHIPGAAGYSAARWAMRALAGQVRADLRGTGVEVTLIAPAEVNSPYFDNNPGSHNRVPKAGVLTGRAASVALIARLSVDAIAAGRREAILPRRAAIVVRLTPTPVLNWLVQRTGWHRPS